MLLAIAITILILALAWACGNRLYYDERLWPALALLPPLVTIWILSLFIRNPTPATATMTFLAGDISLFALSVLGMMRMLGGLPKRDDDGWGDEDEDPDAGAPTPTPDQPLRRRYPGRNDRPVRGARGPRRPRGPRQPRTHPPRRAKPTAPR